VALLFSQYSKLFVSLKRGLRQVGYDRARTTLSTFRLVPSVQHAEKSRMGKGVSKASGFTWRGRPGDLVVLFSRGLYISLALAFVPAAVSRAISVVSFYWRKQTKTLNRLS
jgi:hypothetical protein